MNHSTPTTLYRLYNAESVLLYVGIAGNPGRRFEQHARDKRWWSEVDHIRLEHHRSRFDALAAEMRAIRQECPRYNVAHNIGPENFVSQPFTPAPGGLTIRCDGCRKPIRFGYIKVNHREIDTYRDARQRWDAVHKGRMLSMDQLLQCPEPAQWQAWHEDCDPEPESWSYFIEVGRLRTFADLVDWTAHLMEKNWLLDTNWEDLLRHLHFQSAQGVA